MAFLIRLPYWETIPASFDEVYQTEYAFLIAQGQIRPLVGSDAYTGPFYFYLLAGLFRLGVSNPMLGRVVVLITGTLTVPLAYFWVHALGQNRMAALTAALLLASNPDLILNNSHMGGVTYLLPFLTLLFLWLLVEALNRDHIGWLIMAGVAAGLALQANLVAGLIIAGSLLWFLQQSRHKVQLGRWWPFWPFVIGLMILFVYSPVIIYNVTADFNSLSVLEERSYLWEDDPTWATTLSNWQRLSYQVIRQVSGVLAGSEKINTLIGFPLIYLALMIAGLIDTTYKVSALPLFILMPFWIVMPIFSSHYGFETIGRFTTLLIPVWAATISFLLADWVKRLTQNAGQRPRAYGAIPFLFISFLAIYPATSLFQYYQSVNQAHASGRGLLELSRYAVDNNRGERVYISTIEELSYLRGVPYVPHTTFLIGDIHHEFLPAPQIIGRVFENPKPAFLLLSDQDATTLQQALPLKWVDIAANEEAAWRKYGLYELDISQPLLKPDYVLTENEPIPRNLTPPVMVGAGVRLMGCDVPTFSTSSNHLTFSCYWQVVAEMPPDQYIGFAHLFDPVTSSLVAQDDHVLGQERYPLNAWQADEIIRENYTLPIPDHITRAEFQLWIGIYTWPNLNRLKVSDHPDDIVLLPSIHIDK